MIGYQYDENFRLLGPVPLAPNPRGGFLVPALCTTVEPPTGYGVEEMPAFNEASQSWELVKSYYQLELEATYQEAVSPKGNPLYELDLNGDWVERDAAIVQAEDDVRILQDAYDSQLIILKQSMDATILEKAKEITKGSSLPSVQSFLQAYQLRVNAPEEYVSEGLIVRWAIDGYSVGDALDDVTKIEDYYKKVLIYLDKFREQTIGEYITAKNALPQP